MILLSCILYHQHSDLMLNYLRAANKTFFVTKHKLFRIKIYIRLEYPTRIFEEKKSQYRSGSHMQIYFLDF